MKSVPASNIRVHLLIEGRVQGVFFRAYARDQAVQLRLTGWVRNTSDGRVEAMVEGNENLVETYINWCRQGPPSAKVTQVTVEKQEYRGEFNLFSVRY